MIWRSGEQDWQTRPPWRQYRRYRDQRLRAPPYLQFLMTLILLISKCFTKLPHRDCSNGSLLRCHTSFLMSAGTAKLPSNLILKTRGIRGAAVDQILAPWRRMRTHGEFQA